MTERNHNLPCHSPFLSLNRTLNLFKVVMCPVLDDESLMVQANDENPVLFWEPNDLV